MFIGFPAPARALPGRKQPWGTCAAHALTDKPERPVPGPSSHAGGSGAGNPGQGGRGRRGVGGARASLGGLREGDCPLGWPWLLLFQSFLSEKSVQGPVNYFALWRLVT